MFTSRRITTMGGDKFRDEFSLAFDGTNDHIDCGDVLDQGTGNFSISVWFKLNSGIGQYDCLIAKRTSTGSGSLGWQMDIRGTDPWKTGFAYDDGPTTKTILGSTSIPEDTWNHYVAVIDKTGANKIFAYLNGVEDDTVSGISPLNTISNDAPLSIGCKKVEDNSLHSVFKGNISEIAFYDTALTASQVKTLYNGREPYNHKEGIASGNLKAWWRMGDGRFDGFASEGIWGGSSGLITDELNPTKSSDLFDSGVGDYSSSIGAWSADGSNDVEIDSGAVKITYQNDSDGARLNLNDAADLTTDLTVGKVYEITFASKVNTGSVSVQLNPGLGTGGAGFKTFTITQTDWVYKKHHFNCEHATNCQLKLSGFGLGEELWIKNVRLRELGTNAGILINMAEEDIVGDTP